MRRMLNLSIVVLVTLIWCGAAVADVAVGPLFADHMMLQQGRPLPVWGKAGPGEKVAVGIGDNNGSTTADSEGNWKVVLDPMDWGGPHVMTIRGENTIEIKDVLVGDVWVCSGQSNMQWPVSRSADSEMEINAADWPKIRLFTVERSAAGKPRDTLTASWSVCSPRTVSEFSAVAYYFGRELHQRLGLPVGLIHTSWGGTPAEAWTSRSRLMETGDLGTLVEMWDTRIRSYDRHLDNYIDEVNNWRDEAKQAESSGEPIPRFEAKFPADPRTNPHRASGLYNAMIHPLIPYAIQGAIWYQGESNAGRAYQYRTLFPAMIEDWRDRWGQGPFPFVFVQLANFKERRPDPQESDWAELREAQLMTLQKLPNTGMAVTIDIGEAEDIHPKNKQDVGKRLALWALVLAHGSTVAHSGPIYESMFAEGNKVYLTFRHAQAGLVAEGGGALKGFAVAGADRHFHWADAEIDGNTVIVSSPKVERPVAVRYAWADNPECNLFNRDGLPASPFRTDDWPITTGPKE